MQKSIKAALYSALVFPGIGLLVLKQYKRACVFIIPAALAVAYLTKIISAAADKITAELVKQAEQGHLIVDISTIESLSNKIYQDMLAALAAQQTQLNFAEYVFIASWICSIFSSYFVGKQIERSDQANVETLLKNTKG